MAPSYTGILSKCELHIDFLATLARHLEIFQSTYSYFMIIFSQHKITFLIFLIFLLSLSLHHKLYEQRDIFFNHLQYSVAHNALTACMNEYMNTTSYIYTAKFSLGDLGWLALPKNPTGSSVYLYSQCAPAP